MAENLVLNLGGSIVPEHIGDSIILIDHDIASVASLTLMLEQYSYKVMSVDVASKALSMIEKQKNDIGLVIANIEMPHIDSHSFLDVLLHKDIPLILINPEIKTKETSDLLTKAAQFFLNKPISNNDIKNMWQHVLPKKRLWLNKINIAEIYENQIEVFRENLKSERISQVSLLGRRPFNETFKISETSRKRRSTSNVEWKTKQICSIEIENKREEENNMKNNVGKHSNVWTYERHMKFVASISILGEEKSCPISIMKIINDPNLTARQVSSHLQKYKTQVERISDTIPISEWKSTNKTFKYPSDYKYFFKASDIRKNLIASNSLWFSLRKKLSSSSIAQYSFKKPSAERKEDMIKFNLCGKLDMNNLPLIGSVTNKSFMDVKYVPSAISNNPSYNIPSTDKANHIGLVSTGLSSDNLLVLSALPSRSGALNPDVFQMESARICIPHDDPNLFHPPSSVLETDRNQINLNLTSMPEVPLPDQYKFLPHPTVNPFETQTNLVPCETNYVLNNIGPFDTNTEDMKFVPCEESFDIPIEDLISFDIDVNEMDLGSTNQQHNMMQSCEHHNIEVVNQRENTERGNHFDYDCDCMDWIEEMMNKDA